MNMHNEWKTLESAPEGEDVLVSLDDGSSVVACKDENMGWWALDVMVHPSYWMPLPDPPGKPGTFTKEQKEEIKKWVEANKRFEEIGTVVCLDDSDGLISFIDALPE